MSDYDEADVEAARNAYWQSPSHLTINATIRRVVAAVAPSIAAKARAATVLETADKFERMDIVQFAYWVEESARIARDTTTDRSGT